MKISFTLNNQSVTVETSPYKTVLEIMRDDLGLMGTKKGCQAGECGSCLAFINNNLVNTCLIPAFKIDGSQILTIEGFSLTKSYNLIETAFFKAGVNLCGFCTPGIVMAVEALLNNNLNPSLEEIKKSVSGNICRCISFNTLIEGIKEAAALKRKRRYDRKR